MTTLTDRAGAFAAQAHEGQKRKNRRAGPKDSAARYL